MVYSQCSLRRSLSALRRESRSATGSAANRKALRKTRRVAQTIERSIMPPKFEKETSTENSGYRTILTMEESAHLELEGALSQVSVAASVDELVRVSCWLAKNRNNAQTHGRSWSVIAFPEKAG